MPRGSCCPTASRRTGPHAARRMGGGWLGLPQADRNLDELKPSSRPASEQALASCRPLRRRPLRISQTESARHPAGPGRRSRSPANGRSFGHWDLRPRNRRTPGRAGELRPSVVLQGRFPTYSVTASASNTSPLLRRCGAATASHHDRHPGLRPQGTAPSV